MRSHRRLLKKPAVSRSGMTLLEVVFAIGVVVVGLLGVMALIPLAARYAEDGVTADRSAYIGRAMVEEFSLRGYARPDMWVTWFRGNQIPGGGSSNGFYPLRPPGQFNPSLSPVNYTPEQRRWFRDPAYGWTYSPAGGQAFCIDPRFVANYATPAVRNSGALYTDRARYFPYYQPASVADVRMWRISLRSIPTMPNNPMNTLQALNVFASSDALSLQQPKDRSLEPLQLYTSAVVGVDGQPGIAGIDDDQDGEIDNNSELGWPATDDISAQRLAEKRFSWFATLVPRRNEADASGATDLYTLSIAIVKDRPSDWALDAPSATDPNNERLLGVGFLGGPEVRLVVGTPVDPSSTVEGDERATAELKIEGGHWIMLGAPTATNDPNIIGPPEFRWYRVSSAAPVVRYDQGSDGDWGFSGRDDDGDGVTDNVTEAGHGDDVEDASPSFNAAGPWAYTRNVTLEGPDWDRPEWHWPGVLIVNRSPPPARFRVFLPTRATIVTGVVHVQEKTVRLETSSLWNQGG